MKSLLDIRIYNDILVDAMNMVSRNYHGIKLSMDGVNTGMMYGTVRFILQHRKRYPQATIRFLWEGRNPGRKKVFPLYKANRVRKFMDKVDFVRSLEITKEALRLMGVEQLEHRGLEADDIADHLTRNGEGVHLLVSGDWDWWQFLSQNTDVLYKGEVYRYEDIEKKLGFPPERFALYKSLCGDSSDGIPGVYRFPTAMAEEITSKVTTLEEVVPYLKEHHHDVLASKLVGQMWIAERNMKVLSFGRCHFDPKKLTVESQSPDMEGLKKLFTQYQMKEFLTQLGLG